MLKYELAHITGQRIRKLRKERRMTQKELAIIMRVSRTVVANWEAQTRLPTTEQYCQLASLFNVTSEYLTGRDWYRESETNTDNIEININKLNTSGKMVLLKVYQSLLSDHAFTDNT